MPATDSSTARARSFIISEDADGEGREGTTGSRGRRQTTSRRLHRTRKAFAVGAFRDTRGKNAFDSEGHEAPPFVVVARRERR